MKFEIDFNRENDDETLKDLGAKLVHYDEHSQYEIEINSFEELETLLQKVDSIKKDIYSAIISFDPPCIYLDNKC